MEGVHGASFVGVVPCASSVGAKGACWDEGGVGHGAEGNAACVEEGEPVDAEGGLYRAEPQAGRQKGAACFLEDPLEVH